MKIKIFTLLGALLFSTAAFGVQCDTFDVFDTLIKLYETKEISKEELIYAYDQIAFTIDKKLADQALRVFLQTSINELRKDITPTQSQSALKRILARAPSSNQRPVAPTQSTYFQHMWRKKSHPRKVCSPLQRAQRPFRREPSSVQQHFGILHAKKKQANIKAQDQKNLQIVRQRSLEDTIYNELSHTEPHGYDKEKLHGQNHEGYGYDNQRRKETFRTTNQHPTLEYQDIYQPTHDEDLTTQTEATLQKQMAAAIKRNRELRQLRTGQTKAQHSVQEPALLRKQEKQRKTQKRAKPDTQAAAQNIEQERPKLKRQSKQRKAQEKAKRNAQVAAQNIERERAQLRKQYEQRKAQEVSKSAEIDVQKIAADARQILKDRTQRAHSISTDTETKAKRSPQAAAQNIERKRAQLRKQDEQRKAQEVSKSAEIDVQKNAADAHQILKDRTQRAHSISTDTETKAITERTRAGQTQAHQAQNISVSLNALHGYPLFKEGTHSFSPISVGSFNKSLATVTSETATRWGQQLAQKTTNDATRWQALTPLVKAYTSNDAPQNKLKLIMLKTIHALEDKESAHYKALPGKLRN